MRIRSIEVIVVLIAIIIGMVVGGVVALAQPPNAPIPVSFYLGGLPAKCNTQNSIRVHVGSGALRPNNGTDGLIALWMCVP